MIVRRLPDSELELYHHGIKGQKWGVRRYQNKDRTLTEAGKGRYSKGTKNKVSNISPETKKKLKIAAATVAGLTLVGAAAYLGYKAGGGKPSRLNVNPAKSIARKREKSSQNVSTLTDQELGKAIKRLKMEKEYRKLSDESLHKSKLSIDDTVTKVANATLYSVVAGTTGFALRGLLTGEHDPSALADYIAPLPKGVNKNNGNKKNKR